MTEMRTIDVVRERLRDAARKVGFDVGTPTRSGVRPDGESHGLFHRGRWVGTYELRHETDQTDDAPVVVAHLFLPQAKGAEPEEFYSDGTPVRTNSMRMDMPATIDRAVVRMTIGLDALAKGYDLEPAIAVGTIDRDVANGIALLLQNSIHEAIERLPTAVDIEAEAELERFERIADFLSGTGIVEPDAASDIADRLVDLRDVVAKKPRVECPVPY